MLSNTPKVTVGVIANDNYIIDMINSILFQNYGNIELIVSINQTSDVSICTVFDCINSNAKDNINSININYSKEKLDVQHHREYIVNNATGDYLIVLKDYESFYTETSLAEVLKCFALDTDYVVGNTVIYNENNEYELVTDVLNDYIGDEEQYGVSRYIYVFRRGVNVFSEELQYEKCVQPIMRYKKGTCINEKDTISLEHNLLTINGNRFCFQHYSLNCTNTNKLQGHIKELPKILENGKEEILDKISKEIEYIVGKQRNGYWDFTQSDIGYIAHLLKLRDFICDDNITMKRLKMLSYCIKVQKQLTKKIRIVFFAQEYSVWPCMRPLYEAACADSRYITELVFVPFNHYNKSDDTYQDLELYRKAGYDIKNYSEYNLCQSSPDIAIFVKPYNFVPKGFYIDDIHKVVRRCVYIQYGITIESENKELIRLRYKLPMQYLAWFVLAADLWDYNAAKKYGYTKGLNYLNVGLPRYDEIQGIKEEDYINDIAPIRQMAKGRKVILWNTHHSIDNEGMFGTWLQYGEYIINYIKNTPNLFFVWRPHPLFFGALERELELSEEDKGEFWSGINQIENLHLDTSSDYLPSLLVSDALISDMSSLVKEYLLLSKPILLTLKREDSMPNEELKNVLYLVNDENDIATFGNMIGENKDFKREVRMKYITQNYNSNKKKTVSKLLLDKFVKELREEIRGEIK